MLLPALQLIRLGPRDVILVADAAARYSLQRELGDESVVIQTLKQAKASTSSLITRAPHAQLVVFTRAACCTSDGSG